MLFIIIDNIKIRATDKSITLLLNFLLFDNFILLHKTVSSFL